MENEDSQFEEEKGSEMPEHNYSPSIELFDTRSPYLREKSKGHEEKEHDHSVERRKELSFQNKKTMKGRKRSNTPPPKRKELKKMRKSSEASDISSLKGAKKQKKTGADTRTKTSRAEIRHTSAKSKSPSLSRTGGGRGGSSTYDDRSPKESPYGR